VKVALVTVIGVVLDGLAGAANGRAVVVGAAAAGWVVSVVVPAALPPLITPADPDPGVDPGPDGVQAAAPNPMTTAATTVAPTRMCPVRMCRSLPKCVK
jgi:hypothetical protein